MAKSGKKETGKSNTPKAPDAKPAKNAAAEHLKEALARVRAGQHGHAHEPLGKSEYGPKRSGAAKGRMFRHQGR